jgi:erythritol transport system ATP-binding protein
MGYRRPTELVHHPARFHRGGVVSEPTDEVVLRAVDISKTYGVTRALKGVNFEVRRGKVTVLFGENGAGKSTLMKILSGVEQPSGGHLELDGEVIGLESTTHAVDEGISIIHQELNLCPNLSVRDNIFVGRELRTATGAVDYSREAEIARGVLERLEEEIDPSTLVADLRLGQQQVVEIARALSTNTRILIMDEPTSALSASEVTVLFKIIHELTSQGVAIVYISHHLEEALQVTDHAVVLRDGSITAVAEAADIDLGWIVRNMVGDHFTLGPPPSDHKLGEIALSIDGLSVPDLGNAGQALVDNLSLDVRAGEIVCLYGLMGAGRTELLEAVAGRLPTSHGRVIVRGTDVSRLSIAQRLAEGLGLVPEDRQRDGLVQTMSVGRNMSLASIGRFGRGMVLSRSRESALVEQGIPAVGVKTAGPDAPIGSLSGGNQQKVVIGKILATDPDVILLDEPSRGVDVGAKAEVFRLLAERAASGLAVLYSTSEVNECLNIADRVIVMHRGRISAEFGADEVTKEALMAASGEEVLSAKGGLISIIVNDLSNPYWKLEGDAAKTEARRLGYQATVADHRGDTNTESRLIDTAIANQSVAIILDPVSAETSVGAVTRANAAHIPVFLVNAEINQEGLAKGQLVSNNAQGAALGAQQWVKDVGSKGKYVELLGAPSDNNAATRSNAYQAVLSQYPGLVRVDSAVANWNRSQGNSQMRSMLQAHPDIIGVICGNDEMALGAIEALKQAGNLGQVKVGGLDGSPDAAAAIKAGELQYTVLQPVVSFAKKAVDEADSYLRTGKTGAASEKQSFDCVLITKANVDDFVAPFTLKPTTEALAAASGEEVFV